MLPVGSWPAAIAIVLKRESFVWVHSKAFTSLLLSMSTFRDPVKNFTFETFVAFVGALLVLPLLIKVVFGTLRTLFRMGFVRRLLFDSIVVGATALLTRDDVLDRIFGERAPGKAASKGLPRGGAK